MANEANPLRTDLVNAPTVPATPADPWLDVTKIGPTVDHPATPPNEAVQPAAWFGHRFPVRPDAIRYV